MDSEQELITRYLLGELPEQDRQTVEERLFNDETLLEKIELQEDVLIEQYVRHELSPARSERFESHFLQSPRRRERTEIAGALEKAFERERRTPGIAVRRGFLEQFQFTRRLSWVFATACAAAVVFAGISLWLALRLNQQMEAYNAREQEWRGQTQNLNEQLRQLRAGIPQQNPNERSSAGVSGNVPSAQAEATAALTVLSFIIPPGILRDNSETVLRVRSETQLVELKLETDTPIKPGNYGVVIRAESGKQVWQGVGRTGTLRSKSPAVVVVIPANTLERGQYRLTVTGQSADDVINDYSFRVQR